MSPRLRPVRLSPEDRDDTSSRLNGDLPTGVDVFERRDRGDDFLGHRLIHAPYGQGVLPLLGEETCIRLMLIAASPSSVPTRPIMPGTSALRLTSIAPPGTT